MSVLLFGGTGLIGHALAAALAARGQDVTIASRGIVEPAVGSTSARRLKCDIQDPKQVVDAYDVTKPDIVVHLAAALQFACESDPGLAARVNVGGTNHILEAAVRFGASKVIFASSVAAYGATTARLQEDQAPALSTSLYGHAKWFEERLGIRYAQRHGLKFIALRYCGVFGPARSLSPGMARVRQSIEQSRHGNDVEIKDCDGSERAQLTYVTDAVSATLLAMDATSTSHHVYNVAGPEQNYLSLLEYEGLIRELFPGAGLVKYSGCGRSLGPVDLSRARRDLGFAPSVSVRDGLRQMLNVELGRSND